jgi:hypothetical protein
MFGTRSSFHVILVKVRPWRLHICAIICLASVLLFLFSITNAQFPYSVIMKFNICNRQLVTTLPMMYCVDFSK